MNDKVEISLKLLEPSISYKLKKISQLLRQGKDLEVRFFIKVKKLKNLTESEKRNILKNLDLLVSEGYNKSLKFKLKILYSKDMKMDKEYYEGLYYIFNNLKIREFNIKKMTVKLIISYIHTKFESTEQAKAAVLKLYEDEEATFKIFRRIICDSKIHKYIFDEDYLQNQMKLIKHNFYLNQTVTNKYEEVEKYLKNLMVKETTNKTTNNSYMKEIIGNLYFPVSILLLALSNAKLEVKQEEFKIDNV